MCRITDWIVWGILVVCGICDWRKKEIPVWLMILASVIIVTLSICCKNAGLRSIAGGILLGIMLFVVSKCTKEAIGYGDSWLVLLLGIWLGGTKTLQVLFISSLLACICSLFLLWRHHWKRSATLPFVPFMVLGYLGVMFS